MRHGMTDWNFDGRVQGGLDKSRLNRIGIKQARQAGFYLRSFVVDNILCSPLTRARETLRYLAEASGNPHLSRKAEILPDLKEYQVPWQGLLRRDIIHGPFKKEYSQYKKNPMRFSYNGYNPIHDINRRAQLVWETIARGSASSYLVVSHNQMNKALVCAALGVPTDLSTWNQSNCCFNVFVLEDGKPPRMRLCNGTTFDSLYRSARRARQRHDSVRFILYHEGHTKGLAHEVKHERITHYYYLGSATRKPFEEVAVEDLDSICSNIPIGARQIEDLYPRCKDIVDNIRRVHGNQVVILSTNDGMVHHCLFAACIGIGEERVSHLHSDPGGITVIDLDSGSPIAPGTPRVECYNNFAHPLHGPVLGYTSGIP